MVWGMREPGSFGDYFPDGEYVGRSDKCLEYLLQNGPPDIIAELQSYTGDIARNAHVEDCRYDASQKFTKNLGPLLPHECPSEFHTVKTYTNLGSLILIGALVVDEDLKNIIESLEPDVHQFWPIDISMPKGKIYPIQYYGFRIGQFLDSFSPELSDESSWKVGGLNKDKFRVKFPNKKEMLGLAMQQSSIDGAHLWRETKLKDPDFFLSDDLHDAIVRAKLRVPPFFELKAV